MKGNYREFKKWFKKVNKLCSARIQLDVEDLPDANWLGMFEVGMSPGMALFDFLQDEGIIAQYQELFEDCIDKAEVF